MDPFLRPAGKGGHGSDDKEETPVLQFLAQNHSAMTHLPTASAVLAAAAAIALLFVSRKELSWFCAVLCITAFVTVLPTLVTGIAAAKGRFNEEGKPFIQGGFIAENIPANAQIRRHQILGISGTVVAAFLAWFGVASLRGRSPNRYLLVLLTVLLAILWAVGGHIGGQELWGPATFPAFG